MKHIPLKNGSWYDPTGCCSIGGLWKRNRPFEWLYVTRSGRFILRRQRSRKSWELVDRELTHPQALRWLRNNGWSPETLQNALQEVAHGAR